jgi:serine/threonine protein kinase
MEYLASKNIVHRDIACRNVLLFKEDFAKISDFGMSRELEDCSYYRALGNSKTPFKYIPPVN